MIIASYVDASVQIEISHLSYIGRISRQDFDSRLDCFSNTLRLWPEWERRFTFMCEKYRRIVKFHALQLP